MYICEFFEKFRIMKMELSRTEEKLIHEETSAGICKHSMEARNQVGIGLSYRPTRQRRLAELIPWNRFLSS
jgi:hypothetical protein